MKFINNKLSGEPCFIETDRLECMQMSEYLEWAKKYAVEQDYRGALKDIQKYIEKFRSFYKLNG